MKIKHLNLKLRDRGWELNKKKRGVMVFYTPAVKILSVLKWWKKYPEIKKKQHQFLASDQKVFLRLGTA